MSGEKQIPRRGFLGWLLSGSTGTLLGVLLYPIARFVWPPEQTAASAGSVVAGSVAEFPPNSAKIVRYGARPAIVVRLPTGEFRAFSAVCTHLQCTVQYRAEREQIWCACHNGTFDLSGRNVEGPPPRPLDAFEVALRGDDIVLTQKA
jgi:Rieske Fe-S protein